MAADVTTCYGCRGTRISRWFNCATGRVEDWPCIVCEAAAFDAREEAEGLTPKTPEEPKK